MQTAAIVPEITPMIAEIVDATVQKLGVSIMPTITKIWTNVTKTDAIATLLTIFLMVNTMSFFSVSKDTRYLVKVEKFRAF